MAENKIPKDIRKFQSDLERLQKGCEKNRKDEARYNKRMGEIESPVCKSIYRNIEKARFQLHKLRY
jgi:hypothetical protein